jgi:DNA-binding transcriptional ArsR family regulator
MVVFEFDAEDLARTRFAISPIWELCTSLRMLRDAEMAAMHIPWVRDAMPVARAMDLRAALAMLSPRGYSPDFMTPPPSGPVARIEDELDLLRATKPAQVRHDLEVLVRQQHMRGLPEVLEPLMAQPRRELGRIADRMAEFWDAVLADHWPRIRALFDADLAYRARRLTEGGVARLFADLNHQVSWTGRELRIEHEYEARVALEGSGLLLVPSAFQWQRPASTSTRPWQPTLLYPARGVAALWEPAAERSSEGLARVLGRTRADLLARLATPHTTTDLAALTGLRPGGVSQHLTALRDAGLVSPTRQGRAVLYVRTALADELVTGARSPGAAPSP